MPQLGEDTGIYHQHLLNKDFLLLLFNYRVEMLPPRLPNSPPEPRRLHLNRCAGALQPSARYRASWASVCGWDPAGKAEWEQG